MEIIELNTIYKEMTSLGVDPKTILPGMNTKIFTEFTCNHPGCGQKYSIDDFREACFLYGIFILEGKKIGYRDAVAAMLVMTRDRLGLSAVYKKETASRETQKSPAPTPPRSKEYPYLSARPPFP